MQRPPLFLISAALASMALVFFSPCASARDVPAKAGAITPILVADMPKQGRETLALIRKGGPFPYSKDGSVFGNRERLLPAQPRGHYQEFTVKTPGSRDRGARRIVCGGAPRNQATSACYYTDDHYATFKRIKE